MSARNRSAGLLWDMSKRGSLETTLTTSMPRWRKVLADRWLWVGVVTSKTRPLGKGNRALPIPRLPSEPAQVCFGRTRSSNRSPKPCHAEPFLPKGRLSRPKAQGSAGLHSAWLESLDQLHCSLVSHPAGLPLFIELPTANNLFFRRCYFLPTE